MTHTPTQEQAEIVLAAKTTKDNIMVEALAGAAKTYTLELIAQAITGIPIMSLAFNKRIAEEMARRLPSHVKCMTLNGVGHRAFMSALGKPVSLDTDKMYNLLKEEQNSLSKDDMWEARETFADTLALLRKAKALGFIPLRSYTNIVHLHQNEDVFFEDLEASEGTLITGLQIDLIKKCLDRSVKQAYDGTIDFDDQIFMSTLFCGTFPKFPLTLCDEVQDFSKLNQVMVAKMVGDRRIIAVGDPYQSIYAFRGADSYSMPAMKEQFKMKTMKLSTSFRCPIVGVELARRRAPHMLYPEWAKQGTIRSLEEWSVADIPDGVFVICRNNAPLFNLALQFLKKGRGVNLVGSQLSKGLVKILKKLGKDSLSQSEALDAMEVWKRKQLAKAKHSESKQAIIQDKAECLQVFINAGKTLSEIVAYAEAVFASKGLVSLMSGHKSKGLEQDFVFHLDPHLVAAPWVLERYGPAAMEQELNLQYVIDTRFKDTYTYITTEGLQ